MQSKPETKNQNYLSHLIVEKSQATLHLLQSNQTKGVTYICNINQSHSGVVIIYSKIIYRSQQIHPIELRFNSVSPGQLMRSSTEHANKLSVTILLMRLQVDQTIRH